MFQLYIKKTLINKEPNKKKEHQHSTQEYTYKYVILPLTIATTYLIPRNVTSLFFYLFF